MHHTAQTIQVIESLDKLARLTLDPDGITELRRQLGLHHPAAPEPKERATDWSTVPVDTLVENRETGHRYYFSHAAAFGTVALFRSGRTSRTTKAQMFVVHADRVRIVKEN
jgi:hypothetical protein